MRAALLYGKEDLRVEELPVPEIAAGEVLLRVKAAAICGTDIRMYRNGAKGVGPQSPLVLGHELSGMVARVGKEVHGVQGLAEGARVAVAPNMGCGTCDACVSGNTQLCDNGFRAFGINLPGGFAEYVRIPAEAVRQGNLCPVAPEVSFAAAALAEPLSCVYNAFERCAVRPGDRVLIIGAGPIGLMHAKLARLGGAAKVVLNDLSEERLAICKQLEPSLETVAGEVGERIMSLTGGRGADVVITACPAPEAQVTALKVAAMNGRVLFFGGLPADRAVVGLDTNLVHYRQLTVTGTTRQSLRQYRAVLRLIEDGLLRVDDLVSARWPVDSIREGFAAVMRGSGLKHAVSFEGGGKP
jgi:L-iditol 2-dehydrogenase